MFFQKKSFAISSSVFSGIYVGCKHIHKHLHVCSIISLSVVVPIKYSKYSDFILFPLARYLKKNLLIYFIFITGSTIQKKWKDMRDCFAKELAMQREKSGQGAIKKKKYVHFDSLLFLLPSLQKRETSGNIPSPSQDDPNADEIENLQPTNNNRTTSSKKASKSQNNNDDYEQKLLNSLNTHQNTCEYDEDINFSQMIVPMLRKLNDDQKHFANIEIINILQKAKSFCPSETPIYYSGSRSHMLFTPTPSPQPYHTYSPSSSPTMLIQSPASTSVPSAHSITNRSRSHVSSTPTPSPQSYTYSPSPSPTLPIQSLISIPVPAISSARKKP
ncbi:serine/threonine-protein kinase pakG-like [Diorhabda carinulata]|uniref:serine/threonine-protein kinase pakG-like n=1 Tax=Diorhabda carinulata TaxID=1163345 RepID=UPI0025A1AB7C|nr:serine/threonine-protein kinase pakG-like [Diorhabda carinulata]